MPSKYIHDLKEFPDLLNILASEKNIEAGLVEKDYWIMHVLHGLKEQGFSFRYCYTKSATYNQFMGI